QIQDMGTELGEYLRRSLAGDANPLAAWIFERTAVSGEDLVLPGQRKHIEAGLLPAKAFEEAFVERQTHHAFLIVECARRGEQPPRPPRLRHDRERQYR